MAKVSKIERILEAEHGNLHNVIPALVNKHGQEETARLLNVRQGWVSRWLKLNGYQLVTEYRLSPERQAQLLGSGVQAS